MNDINWEALCYFTEEEFTCKCGCGVCNVSMDLLHKLIEARRSADIPFVISSGCRCRTHNVNEGGRIRSLHISSVNKECRAVDIKANTSRKRGIIVRSLFEAGFNHIGINFKEKFIHVDLDKRIALFPY